MTQKPPPSANKLENFSDALASYLDDPTRNTPLREVANCNAFQLINGKVILDLDCLEESHHSHRSSSGELIWINRLERLLQTLNRQELVVGCSRSANPLLPDLLLQIDENDVFSKKSLDNQDIPPEPDGVVTEEEFEHFQRRLMGDYLQYLIDRMSNDTQRAAAFIKRIHQAGILLPGETREAPDYYLPNPKLTEYKEETLKRHYNQSDDPDERQALAREWNHRNAIDYLYRNDHSPVNIYSNKITVWASKLYHDLPNMDGYEWGDQFQPPALAQLAANACRRDLIILVEDTDREGQDDQGNPTHVSGYYSAQYDGITGSLVVVSSSSIWEPSRQRVVQSEFSSDEEAKIKEALIRLVGVRVRRRALEARDLLIQQFTDLGIFDDEDLQ